jgi:predicted nuclease of predicted toxin-antitoxin system
MWGCLTDEHIALAFVNALRLAGLDVVTAHERDLLGTDDYLIAREARKEERLLLTSDQDFLRIAAHDGSGCPPILFLPTQGKRRIKHLVALIRELAMRDDYEVMCGQVFYL